MKKIGIVEIWDRFNQWKSRYRKSCLAQMDRDEEYNFNSPRWMFALNRLEMLADDYFVEPQDDIETRISEKVAFLQGYLVAISMDGPEFMYARSRFLPTQYPSRCNNALGFWFQQQLEGDPEVGGYFGFQGWEAQLFIDRPKDLDFASVRVVLPFDDVLVRKPRGVCWTATEAEELLKTIRDDLEFDGYHFESGVAGIGSPFLQIHFKWS